MRDTPAPAPGPAATVTPEMLEAARRALGHKTFTKVKQWAELRGTKAAEAITEHKLNPETAELFIADTAGQARAMARSITAPANEAGLVAAYYCRKAYDKRSARLRPSEVTPAA